MIYKAFNIRIPKELWSFLKKTAVEQERSMQDIIVERLSKYKNKYEKKLTHSDTNV